MRRLEWLACAVFALAFGFFVSEGIDARAAAARPEREVARPAASRLPCPCRADGCSMPCTTCCGPRGMVDCLGLDGGPTVAAVESFEPCGRGNKFPCGHALIRGER